MAKRLAIFFTSILLVAAGAVGAYLVVTIPRDIEAEKLLKQAREELKTDQRDEARKAFESVIQKYPRTDAAGAAINALFRMNDQERAAINQQLAALKKATQTDRTRIGNVEKLAVEISKRPPPPPTVVAKSAPKPTPKKKTTTKKRSTKRR